MIAVLSIGCGDDLPSPVYVETVTRYLVGASEEIETAVPDDASVFYFDDGDVVEVQGTVDGEWLRFDGVLDSDLFLVRVGQSYYATADRQFVVNSYSLGRKDAVHAENIDTALTLSITNLAPWTRQDDLVVFSPQAGAYERFSVEGALNAPAPDDVALMGVEVNYWEMGEPLIRASLGDEFYIFQLEHEIESLGGLHHATRVFYSNSVSLEDGSSNIVTGVFSEAGRRTIAIPFSVSEHEALAPLAGADAVPSDYSCRVYALPGADRYGSYGGGFNGCTLAQVLPAVGANSGEFSFVDPFPEGWLRATCVMYFEVPTTSDGLPPFAELAHARSDWQVVGTSPPFDGQPALLPVTDIMLDDVAVADADIVDPTPIVKWTPPAASSSLEYVVEVIELSADEFGISVSYDEVFTTSMTELRVPPGVFESGVKYYLRVTVSAGEPEFRASASHVTQPFRVQ